MSDIPLREPDMHASSGGLTEKQANRMGAVAMVLFTLHATHQFYLGHSQHLLWTCPMATLLVGLGLMIDSRRVCSSGVLILCVGLPAYALHVVNGGEAIPITGFLIHFGGIAIGLLAIRSFGIGRRDWVVALLIVVATLTLSRHYTGVQFNINFAFRSVFSHDPTRSSWNHLPYLCLGWGLALWFFNRMLTFAWGPGRRTA
jgi:hypothetical protein